jgi:hypothetical protein
MNMSRKRDLLRMVLAISTLQPTNRLYTNCVLVSFDTRVLIINYMDFVLFFFNLLPPAYAELLSMLSDDVCHLFHLFGTGDNVQDSGNRIIETLCTSEGMLSESER